MMLDIFLDFINSLLFIVSGNPATSTVGYAMILTIFFYPVIISLFRIRFIFLIVFIATGFHENARSRKIVSWTVHFRRTVYFHINSIGMKRFQVKIQRFLKIGSEFMKLMDSAKSPLSVWQKSQMHFLHRCRNQF